MYDFKLNFLGTGSCFNTEFGNNSAYFKYKRMENGAVVYDGYEDYVMEDIRPPYITKLVLIDTGETIFERLTEKRILDDVDEVDILIIHLHSDHVGSLPSIIFYLYIVKGIKPNLLFKGKLKEYLDLSNVNPDFYNILDITALRYLPVKVKHGTVKDAFGYIVNIIPFAYAFYYSGDSCEVPSEILEKFRSEKGESMLHFKISRIYQDVTKYENDVHMNIHSLAKIFKEEERKKVTCMHFDDVETMEIAKSYGFDVAEV